MDRVNTQQNQASALITQLQKQRHSFEQSGGFDFQTRLDKLNQLKHALIQHQQHIVSALANDYGHRASFDTLLADVMPCINQINYTRKHLAKWTKPSRRHAGLLLAPANVKVHYQPLGVIGIIVPWNFPVMLSLGPLITAVAAGNHAMIKLSEFTPAVNQVIKQIVAQVFSDEQVYIVEGEADVAAQFSALPFDHLLFTGSTEVAKHVMRAAAENLTPVTLELGGKSPVIIAPDMDIDIAVERMIFGKCLNAGQICVSPDYVLLPKDKQQAFIDAYKTKFEQLYPNFIDNQDYSNVINLRQFERLLAVIEDAKQQGAQVEPVTSNSIDIPQRKMATQLISQVTDSMLVMQQEIFGPLLPIVAYDDLEQAISYVNQRPRPLALYIMSFEQTTSQQIISRTHSGGVCVNETVFHVAADDAPFGGIGPSGMGHYHGKEGFLSFSHAKTVLSRGRFNTGKLVHPPYGNKIQQLLFKIFMR